MCCRRSFSSRVFCVAPLYSKVSRPDKLAVHVFEVDEDVDKDEVSLFSVISNRRNWCPVNESYLFGHCFHTSDSVILESNMRAAKLELLRLYNRCAYCHNSMEMVCWDWNSLHYCFANQSPFYFTKKKKVKILLYFLLICVLVLFLCVVYLIIIYFCLYLI